MTSKKNPGSTNISTLSQALDAYTLILDSLGKSEATVKSYTADLKIAKKHFGDKQTLKGLNSKVIDAFHNCDAVSLNRQGKPKNKITSDKIKRVFRQALTWAVSQGFIEESQVPNKSK